MPRLSILTVPDRNVPYLFLERAKKKALRFYVSLGTPLKLPKLFGPIPSEFGELDGQHWACSQIYEHTTKYFLTKRG